MPVVRGRDGKRIVGTGRGGGRRGQGGGGTEPPGHRDLRAHRDRDAVVTEDLGDDPCREMGRVVEQARALPLAVHAQ